MKTSKGPGGAQGVQSVTEWHMKGIVKATQEIQNSPVGMGDRWKSLPEIDQSYEKMEMEWIAEAIENDWKLTERRFLKFLSRTVPYQTKIIQKFQLVASIWRLKRKHCTKFETKMMKIVVKSEAFTPGNEFMEIEKETLYQIRNEKVDNCREKLDIYSCSNREASLTEASVVYVADQQYFRWYSPE